MEIDAISWETEGARKEGGDVKMGRNKWRKDGGRWR
jgi:hypothetical protein